MSKHIIRISAALCLVSGLAGCLGPGDLYSGGGRQLVLPTRGYTHPGWTGKQVYEALQECYQRVQADPQYQAMRAEVLKLPEPYEHRTKEQIEVEHRWNMYEAQSMGNCKRSKGLKYGKVKPEDYYRPPPPPEWFWAKPGVSQADAGHEYFICKVQNDRFVSNEESDACMDKKGFKWQIVDPHPSQ